MVAVSAPLKGADLVVEALDEAQRDLVFLVAIRLDTVPGLLPQARLACDPIDIPPARRLGRLTRPGGRVVAQGDQAASSGKARGSAAVTLSRAAANRGP